MCLWRKSNDLWTRKHRQCPSDYKDYTADLITAHHCNVIHKHFVSFLKKKMKRNPLYGQGRKSTSTENQADLVIRKRPTVSHILPSYCIIMIFQTCSNYALFFKLLLNQLFLMINYPQKFQSLVLWHIVPQLRIYYKLLEITLITIRVGNLQSELRLSPSSTWSDIKLVDIDGDLVEYFCFWSWLGSMVSSVLPYHTVGYRFYCLQHTGY